MNKVETKVRLTHIPTGIVVMCQTDRSQLGNRMKAMQMLRTKLYDEGLRRIQEAESQHRKSQVSSGDRSAKIRTYNYGERRVTDHRIKLTVHALDKILVGELDEFTDALQADERRARLAEQAEKV